MIRIQAGAIPYRRDGTGRPEVMLVTSRRRGRWVFPKGRVKKGELPHHSAAREAFEEGGVLGAIERLPLASYRQRKFAEDGASAEIVVRTYPLHVNTQLRTWPEMAVRRRRWVSIEEASDIVRDAALREVLLAFSLQYSK